MIAAADTWPLCYLILIGEIELLPKLFERVWLPQTVVAELLHEEAPDAVRGWASELPSWVAAQEDPVGAAVGMEKLQAGETAAIILALAVKANSDAAASATRA